MSPSIAATLIAGDGIGPEIVDATLQVLEALGAPFVWDTQIAGAEGVRREGDPLPASTLASIRRTRLALKGPLETPSGFFVGEALVGGLFVARFNLPEDTRHVRLRQPDFGRDLIL